MSSDEEFVLCEEQYPHVPPPEYLSKEKWVTYNWHDTNRIAGSKRIKYKCLCKSCKHVFRESVEDEITVRSFPSGETCVWDKENNPIILECPFCESTDVAIKLLEKIDF